LLDELRVSVETRLDRLESAAAPAVASDAAGSSTPAPTPTWAARASAVAGAPAPAPLASTMAHIRNDKDYDEALLLLDTHLGARILLSDLLVALDRFLSEANLARADWSCTGAAFGKAFKLRFTGSPTTALARAKQVQAFLRNDGDWRDLRVCSPRAGEDDVRVYIKADQSVAQKRSSHRWRCLKRAFGPLGPLSLVYEIRDRVVSLDYHAVAQLESCADGGCRVAWFRTAADKAITREAQIGVETAFAAELERGPQRG
jgi:hypothetical protein